MQLAGRYLQKANQKIKPLLNDPSQAAVAGGAAAAGLATLGNITSGEASQEGPGRLLLEAGNAALLGGMAGAAIPSLRMLVSKRTIAQNVRDQDMGVRGTGQGVELGAQFGTPEATKMREEAAAYMGAVPYAQGALGAGLITAAGMSRTRQSSPSPCATEVNEIGQQALVGAADTEERQGVGDH